MSVAFPSQRVRVREERAEVLDPRPLAPTRPNPTPAPARNPSGVARKSRASLREARIVLLAKMGLFAGSLLLVLAAGVAYLYGPIRLQTEQTRKISLIKREGILKEQVKQLQLQKMSLLDPELTATNAAKSQMSKLDTRRSVILQ